MKVKDKFLLSYMRQKGKRFRSLMNRKVCSLIIDKAVVIGFIIERKTITIDVALITKQKYQYLQNVSILHEVSCCKFKQTIKYRVSVVKKT